jgi:hypothetical protein
MAGCRSHSPRRLARLHEDRGGSGGNPQQGPPFLRLAALGHPIVPGEGGLQGVEDQGPRTCGGAHDLWVEDRRVGGEGRRRVRDGGGEEKG